MAESFDEFSPKEYCRECSTEGVLCLEPWLRHGHRDGHVKIFGHLRLLATNFCERISSSKKITKKTGFIA